MKAGKMRHKVRLERRVSQQDAAGQPLGQWVTLAERRAAMETAAGTEVFAGDQKNGRLPTVFLLRYHPLVLPSMRLILISEDPHRVFNIVSAEPKGQGARAELVITAVEHVEEAVPT